MRRRPRVASAPTCGISPAGCGCTWPAACSTGSRWWRATRCARPTGRRSSRSLRRIRRLGRPRSTGWGGSSPTTTGAGWWSCHGGDFSSGTTPRRPCCPRPDSASWCCATAGRVRCARPSRRRFWRWSRRANRARTGCARSRPPRPRRWPACWQRRPPSPRASRLPMRCHRCHSTPTPGPTPTPPTGRSRCGRRPGSWCWRSGRMGSNAPLYPWNRDAFSMPLTGADAVPIAQLGVSSPSARQGQADAALVSLGGVGPDAAATFTRVMAGA